MKKIMLFLTTLFFIANAYDCSYAQSSGLQHWKSKDVLGSVGLVLSLDIQKNEWYPFGTGVYVDIDSTLPHVFFITNRHILANKDTLEIRTNVYREDSLLQFYEEKSFPFSKTNSPHFYPQASDSDFAVIIIDRPTFEGFNPIYQDEITYTPSLEYGQDVEFYGYPLYRNIGLFKRVFNFPILRAGNISYFASDNSIPSLLPSMFLIDGVSFGGGSGSPVFAKTLVIKDSSKITFERKLIGIISGHYPLRSEIEIKPITDSTEFVAIDSLDLETFIKTYRFSYRQNSDLAIVISADILIIYITTNYVDCYKQFLAGKLTKQKESKQ